MDAIILWVDWEQERVDIYTKTQNSGCSDREQNRLATEFILPDNTDFSEFPVYYRDEIKPVLEKLSESFEVVYDGNRYVGEFDYDTYDDLFRELDNILENAPTHSIQWIGDTSTREYFENIPKILESAGIDIMTADFDDYETLNNAINALEAVMDSDVVLFGVDYEADLKKLQEKLQEAEIEACKNKIKNWKPENGIENLHKYFTEGQEAQDKLDEILGFKTHFIDIEVDWEEIAKIQDME